MAAARQGMMGKRSADRDHPDPAYRRWRRKYPRFPGVAECLRLVKTRKALGTWADFIAAELAENAAAHLLELIAAFRSEPSEDVRLYIMMALDLARPPEAAAFLAEVLREGNPRLVTFATMALQGIDTKEARTALWNAASKNRAV